uniref:LIM interaction domain-containing protein n=1 Tax=Romanomermis culicivorax TaxID=13658 RepID=A0A915IZ94_ROMCU
MFEAGVTDLYYMVRSSSDMRHPSLLECERVTVVSTHDSPYYMQVQTNGRLVCEFAYPIANHIQTPDDTAPRIKTWDFLVIDHIELIPRDELQNPAIMQNFDMCKSVTRHGILPAILNYLRLCYILEPMQELMAHYRIHEQAPNGQTMLSPQECLKRVAFQKFNLLNRGAQPSAQAMMPPEGSSSGGTTTPTGPGTQQGKKKPVASPSPAIMPPMGMSASNVTKTLWIIQPAVMSITTTIFFLLKHTKAEPKDVMVVLEPSLMGGEYGDEDERYIQRLENTQYDPAAANAQMTMSSPVTSVGMLSNAMMPPHLQPDRSFDPSMVWPGGPPAHLQHHSASVSGPNTPIGRTTTPSLMMHPQLVSSPANMLGGGSAPPPPQQQPPPSSQHQIIRQGGIAGSQNGSRQSTPNATPTEFKKCQRTSTLLTSLNED